MKKTAVVTGSSRGIGFAIAKQLGMDGYNIVMVATGLQEKNQAALDELQALGIACAYVQANIGNQEDRQKILDGALAAFGRVDVLVNNAGVAPKVRADLLDMSEESFDYVVGINTKGNMFLTQLIAKQMIQQEPLDGRKGVIVNVSSCSSVVSSTNRGEYCVSKAGISMLTTLYPYLKESHGSVINFASGAGLFGNFGQSAYAAAKEGIRGLSRVAATEWGKDGINVNIVCPLAWTAKLEQFQQAYPDAFKANVKMPPMGHYGNAETEIGRVCVQLASPDFKFMSGETLTLEGGMGQRP
mgnify:CR=1 FL=1|jgi:3-oxoacyl-[acyl-carrier protein] reductase